MICIKTATLFYSMPRGCYIHKWRGILPDPRTESIYSVLSFLRGSYSGVWLPLFLSRFNFCISLLLIVAAFSYKVDCNMSHGQASFRGHAAQCNWIRRVCSLARWVQYTGLDGVLLRLTDRGMAHFCFYYSLHVAQRVGKHDWWADCYSGGFGLPILEKPTLCRLSSDEAPDRAVKR